MGSERTTACRGHFGYSGTNVQTVNGKALRCLRAGAVHMDRKESQTFLESKISTGPKAALKAERCLLQKWEAAVLQ